MAKIIKCIIAYNTIEWIIIIKKSLKNPLLIFLSNKMDFSLKQVKGKVK